MAERAVAGRGMRRANCFLDARPAVDKLAPVWNAALHATDLRKSQETPPPMNLIAASTSEVFAVIALIFAIATGIFWMVVGWRAMRAHERMAESHEALSRIASFLGAKYGQPDEEALHARRVAMRGPLPPARPEAPRNPLSPPNPDAF